MPPRLEIVGEDGGRSEGDRFGSAPHEHLLPDQGRGDVGMRPVENLTWLLPCLLPQLALLIELYNRALRG